MFYFCVDFPYEENLEDQFVEEVKLPRINRKAILDIDFDDDDLKETDEPAY